jgi:hypothetical protein
VDVIDILAVELLLYADLDRIVAPPVPCNNGVLRVVARNDVVITKKF